MALFKGKFDSVKQDWTTPKELFDKLNNEFGFTCDLAASPENALCPKFFTKEDNGLLQQWSGVCWLNPPFGQKNAKMIDWIKKSYEDSQLNSNLTVVMFIPARTNNKWWAKYCMNAKEVRFIIGRPKFGGATHGLPQPLCLVIFGKTEQPTKFSAYPLK